MGFTTPCFIRKNTDNIRNKLKEYSKWLESSDKISYFSVQNLF